MCIREGCESEAGPLLDSRLLLTAFDCDAPNCGDEIFLGMDEGARKGLAGFKKALD